MAIVEKPGCANPLVGAETDEMLMKTTFEILERRNIIGVTSGPLADRWRELGGDRIIPCGRVWVRLRCTVNSDAWANGSRPSATWCSARWASSTKAFLPVTLASSRTLLLRKRRTSAWYSHRHRTAWRTLPPGLGGYRARLHSALGLEDALVRHPKLRVYIMHAGWPMLDDLLAVLWAHLRYTSTSPSFATLCRARNSTVTLSGSLRPALAVASCSGRTR